MGRPILNLHWYKHMDEISSFYYNKMYFVIVYELRRTTKANYYY